MRYNIVESINSYLKEIEMEQSELARLICCSQEEIAKILQGDNMDVETARKISLAVRYNFLQEMGYNVNKEILEAEGWL